MNKKLIIAATFAMCAFAAFARPHGGPGFGGPRGGFGHRPPPVMHHGGYHHHHHGSFWGHGGRNFWPGFVGGVVGSAIYGGYRYPSTVVYPTTTVVSSPIVTTPVVTTPVVTTTPVVATPVYTTQQVWVEGRYIDQVQPNGTVIRVWQPGHYETRQVLVQ